MDKRKVKIVLGAILAGSLFAGTLNYRQQGLSEPIATALDNGGIRSFSNEEILQIKDASDEKTEGISLENLIENAEKYEGKFVRVYGGYHNHNFFEAENKNQSNQFNLYIKEQSGNEPIILKISHNHNFGETCEHKKIFDKLKNKANKLEEKKEICIGGTFFRAYKNPNPKGYQELEEISGVIIQTK